MKQATLQEPWKWVIKISWYCQREQRAGAQAMECPALYWDPMWVALVLCSHSSHPTRLEV